ncbi:MAG: hypothetical protein K8T26_17475 [Lentisphaerae bacterium]|nr:hypothetical protein [Lentisphaerota bacterium]
MRKYAPQLARRMSLHRAFHARREPGDLLVYINAGRSTDLNGFLCARLHEREPDVALQPEAVEAAIREYVNLLHGSFDHFYSIDDDRVPCAIVYWGIGGITAAMVGRDPWHDGGSSWLEPNLAWSEIEGLSFDPANKWIGLARDVNRALWKYWDEDFLVMPYVHRSPLDAANGIRGTELFAEMYEAPERVQALTDWCADWSIAVERHLKAQAPRPAGWGVGIWGVWLPDDAVFVNGDPVGLIGRTQAETFDRPSTEKLFTQTGGGFYHNHTVGLHQADLVSSYRGALVQWYVDDPKQPSLASALLDHPKLRDTILAASLQCPIAGWVPCDRLDELLNIVVEGRFMLTVACPEGTRPDPILQKVRSVSNLT